MANRRQDALVADRAGDRRALIARAALYLAVAYITLTTSDITVGRVPLKLFVVAFALIAWLAVRRPWDPQRRSYDFAAPVILAGIAIPLVWFACALILHHRHDPAQTEGIGNAVQQASRFAYLLLYFPILDELRRCAAVTQAGADRLLRMHRVWLWPTLVLCGISLLLFLGHTLLGLDYGRGSFGPFQGAIAPESTGAFRVYLVDDVVLIPAAALLIGSARRGRLGDLGLGVTFALLSTAYVSHTRGIWLGMIVAAAVIVLLTSVPTPRSPGARALAALLGCAFLLAFVVNADPNVSHRAVSFLTARNELSTSYRLEQGPQLLRGFRRHVLVGSGLGATLPSGFRRSQSEPWSFELSYLQLLFQLGVIGVVLLFAAPALALFRGVRSLRHVDRDRRVAVAVAIGGIVGFLFTSGGNPYLMTSVGMLALAVLLAMTEQAMEITSPLTEPLDAAFSSSLSTIPAFTRLASLRLRRPTTLVCIVTLIGVLGVAEFGRSRRATPPPGAHQSASPISAKRRVLRLPSRYLHDKSARLVSNGDSASDSSVWSVNVAKGALRASRWRLGTGKIHTGPVVNAGPLAQGEDPRFGIVSLGAAHPDALGVITNFESRIHVELRDLSHAGRVLTAGTTVALPLRSGEHRDVGLATWIGTSPDLIVIDRSTSAPAMRIRVFSAASAFREELLNVVVPKGPFPARAFSLLVGAVNSPTADLTLVSRGPTSSAHTEVHVLLGPQAFLSFGEQSPVSLPEKLPHTTTFLLGHEDGRAVLYTVNRAAAVLEVVQL